MATSSATSKPVVAAKHLTGNDRRSLDKQYAVPDVVEDYVPVKLATSDGKRTTAADTALRSATTLQDPDTPIHPLGGSNKQSFLINTNEVRVTSNFVVLCVLHGHLHAVSRLHPGLHPPAPQRPALLGWFFRFLWLPQQ